MSRSAADVEDANLAFGPRQLRDQHVVVALLGDGEVAELELEVRVPQPIVQIFHAQELLREDQPQLATVHFLGSHPKWWLRQATPPPPRARDQLAPATLPGSACTPRPRPFPSSRRRAAA